MKQIRILSPEPRQNTIYTKVTDVTSADDTYHDFEDCFCIKMYWNSNKDDIEK